MSNPDKSDAALVKATLGGDEEALETLYERHSAPLLSFLQMRSGEAEDIFQESWMRALKHLKRFKTGSFRAWLIVIGRNALIDRYRRYQPTISLDYKSTADSPSLIDFLPDLSPNIPEELASNENYNNILTLVNQLPATQREVFLLRTQQQLTFMEIATLLDIPLNTALGRMHYAVTKLRKQLKNQS